MPFIFCHETKYTFFCGAIFVIATTIYQGYLENLGRQRAKNCLSFYFQRDYYAIIFKGKIIKKYRDKQNHGFQYLDIDNNGTHIKIFFPFTEETNTPFSNSFWHLAEESDSIFKNKNSTKVILRKRREATEFDIDCEKHKRHTN